MHTTRFWNNHSSGKYKAKIFERRLKVSKNKEVLNKYLTVQGIKIIYIFQQKKCQVF